MITYEQRLLMILEGIRDELHEIREELQNYHGDKSKENNTDTE